MDLASLPLLAKEVLERVLADPIAQKERHLGW